MKLYRTIKDIKTELEIIDERLRSKTLLLKDFPNEFGLQLSILEFKGRKNDLKKMEVL